MTCLLLSLWVLLCPPFAATAPAPDPFEGVWLDGSRDARVEITRQGRAYTSRYVGFRDVAASRATGYRVGAVAMKELTLDGQTLAGRVIDWETRKDYYATLTPTTCYSR